MESNSVCKHTRDKQIASRSSDFVITRMITDRIGLHSVLLLIFSGLVRAKIIRKKQGADTAIEFQVVCSLHALYAFFINDTECCRVFVFQGWKGMVKIGRCTKPGNFSGFLCYGTEPS